jgi:ubiquinone/menaquinone biosynthesis C-methylase UbiE
MSQEQARFYEEQAEAYDALIAAEDADGRLLDELTRRLPLDGARIADVGSGTGRLARMLAERATHVTLVDRAAPMLEVARRRLEAMGLGERVTIEIGDARALPLGDGSVEVAMAGWVFGHFRHWMPDGWRDEVDAALAEMRRVVVTDGHIVVIETLGTGHERPREHPELDEYFEHLEAVHGLSRFWLRTDYQFDDVEGAVEVLGPFFGEELVERIRREEWRRVPECTAVFMGRA